MKNSMRKEWHPPSMTRHGTVEELTSLPYNNQQGGGPPDGWERGRSCDNPGNPPHCS